MTSMSAYTAMSMLLKSRDGQPAEIWHDNGRTIGRLARTAGVLVTWLHVDFAAGTVERRTADGREGVRG